MNKEDLKFGDFIIAVSNIYSGHKFMCGEKLVVLKTDTTEAFCANEEGNCWWVDFRDMILN